MSSISLPFPMPTGDAAIAPSAAPVPVPSVGPVSCANCSKAHATLRCGICRKKSYCDRNCQRQDWPFHKRICEKPKFSDADALEPKGPPSSSSADAAPVAPAPPAVAPAPALARDSTVELDAEDLAAIADVKKKGYAYHAQHARLAAAELQAIGDNRPKLAAVASSSSGGGQAAPSSAAPAPAAVSLETPKAPPTSAACSSASVWNSGGTVEERDATAWVRGRLKELMRARSSELCCALPGVGRLEVVGIEGWGDSSADVLISRGKARFLYDIHCGFTVELVTDEALAGCPDLAEVLLAGAGPVHDDASGDVDSVAPGNRPKQPRAIVRFPDVSNDTEGQQLEVRVAWGKPAPKDGNTRELITTTLHNGGIVASLRALMEALIADFKAR